MDITERFLKYVSFDTQSAEKSQTHPSTEKQKLLGSCLAEELASLGMENAHMDEFGYVYGWIPATPGREQEPCLGFIAHMDTSPDASGKNVKARIVTYLGGDLVLNEEKSIVMRAADFEGLARYMGQELIVTDGTTLLGADDKAGVAEIVTMAEYLLTHPEIAHGPIAVGFTPDEEVGQGADLFDIPKFGAAAAYTVDGGELGEIEYENFNAANATFYLHGVNIHPGTAKNKMKNAALLAVETVNLLPPAETPAHTEGYEGFYHVHTLRGDETEALVGLLIRDHDREKFEARKAYLQRLADYLNGKYGLGTVELALRDSYYNMKEQIAPHMELIENAKAAMRSVGVEPVVMPIRGGTDGAQLSYKGLPCPNLCTGGANFHGVHEFIPVESLRKTVEILVALASQSFS